MSVIVAVGFLGLWAGGGQIPAGHYTASRAVTSLPKLSSLSSAQQDVFTGIVFFIRDGDYTHKDYLKGQLDLQYAHHVIKTKEWGTLREKVAHMPKGTEIRYAVPGFLAFQVDLPKNMKRLSGFTGLLSKLEGEMVRFVRLKDGKFVSSDLKKNQ